MTWGAAARRCLEQGPIQRWHFQHGPIDLIIGIEGQRDQDSAIELYVEQAWQAFQEVLPTLARQIPFLFQALPAAFEVQDQRLIQLEGHVAKTMWAASLSFSKHTDFLTPMAAVAGSVAQYLLGYFARDGIAKVWINNGGDIAWWAAEPKQRFQVGIPEAPAGLVCQLAPSDQLWGVATSGWRGRSFSFGIADAVTVLARSASVADVAATLIANQVRFLAPEQHHPLVVRRPANQVKDMTDLGERRVTVDVGALPANLVQTSLHNGQVFAEKLLEQGLIGAAVLCLQGQMLRVGPIAMAKSGINQLIHS